MVSDAEPGREDYRNTINITYPASGPRGPRATEAAARSRPTSAIRSGQTFTLSSFTSIRPFLASFRTASPKPAGHATDREPYRVTAATIAASGTFLQKRIASTHAADRVFLDRRGAGTASVVCPWPWESPRVRRGPGPRRRSVLKSRLPLALPAMRGPHVRGVPGVCRMQAMTAMRTAGHDTTTTIQSLVPVRRSHLKPPDAAATAAGMPGRPLATGSAHRFPASCFPHISSGRKSP